MIAVYEKFGLCLVAVLLGTVCLPHGEAAETQALRGEVTYVPAEGDATVAERFRLEPHRFTYQMQPIDAGLEGIDVWDVQFPSPVTTMVPENNTVHCEYFQPRTVSGSAGAPAVVVLHILGGDFPLARLFCIGLAQRGCGALFLKMPYYGPRRSAESPRRMVSDDARQTVEGMTQAILDIRRATAWLAARSEVDSDRLGIFGISLGAITGALAATAEPRLENVCLLLAGGDLGAVGWQSPELARTREQWLNQGGTKEEFFELMKAVDPVVYARNVHGRRILMLNATEDEVIPRACTESLWNSFGQPELVWFPGGHYSVAKFLPVALQRVGDFFVPPAQAQ